MGEPLVCLAQAIHPPMDCHARCICSAGTGSQHSFSCHLYRRALPPRPTLVLGSEREVKREWAALKPQIEALLGDLPQCLTTYQVETLVQQQQQEKKSEQQSREWTASNRTYGA